MSKREKITTTKNEEIIKFMLKLYERKMNYVHTYIHQSNTCYTAYTTGEYFAHLQCNTQKLEISYFWQPSKREISY